MSQEIEQTSFTLPVSGRTVVIREGDGFADRLLLKKNKKPYEVIFDYLASFIVSIDGKGDITADDVLDLFSPDQEALSLECYKWNYGRYNNNMFDFTHVCSACDYEELRSIPIDNLDFKALSRGLVGPDPTIAATLPVSGKKAVIGMLTGHKEMLLLQQAMTTGADLIQANFQAIRSLDGEEDFTFEDVAHLKLADHKAIRRARRQLICGYDLRIKVACTSCGEVVSFNLLTHSDFLLPAG